MSIGLLARYQRSRQLVIVWRQLVIGQSNDVTRRWGFPRIKVISTNKRYQGKKPLPQTEQLPHLNQPCEWSELFLFAEEQL